MITKDETYHKSAVFYNEEMAKAAENLAENVEHPIIQKWCRAVGKQHRYHEKKHRHALDRMSVKPTKGEDEVASETVISGEGN